MFETALVKAARDFAIKAHGSQMYGDSPYSRHLQDVVDVLYDCAPDQILTEHHVAAAWLHDTVEDTEFKVSDIKREFGDKVAEIVFAVTNEVGRSRVEKTLKTMQKVRSAGRDATMVKLADRIANMEYSFTQAGKHFKMYQREYPIFKWSLSDRGYGIDRMWIKLDEVSRLF